MKFAYVNGEKIGVYEDGKHAEYESSYIRKYKESVLRSAKSKEWKRRTDVEISDEYYAPLKDEERVDAAIYGVSFTDEEQKLIYSFGVNETSGVYFKYLDDKEKTEAHALSSNRAEFKYVSTTKQGDTVGCVLEGVAGNIAVFSKDGSDYKCVTDGDTLDEHPSFDKDGNILFNSYAVARDANNNFITYMPSELYRLDLNTMEVQTLLSDGKYSYIKPIGDSKGNIYCIRKPAKEKEGNAFIDFLMIPVRIIQAIVGFVATFVMCFARKPMVGGTSARSLGDGELSKENKGKKVMINNHLLDVEKELKRNAKWSDMGFIPKSWTLVKLVPSADGSFQTCEEYDLAYGVADFALFEEAENEVSLIYTDGKHIYEVKDFGKDGKKDKILNVDFCVAVSTPIKGVAAGGDPFTDPAEAEPHTPLFDRL